MKFGKKKAETTWASGWARGPERRPERSAKRVAGAGAEARGPNLMPKWFQLFFCRTSWIPPWFQDLLPKVFVNITKTVQKINEYQVTKIKKYAGFLLKSCIGDIWDKNTALYFIQYLCSIKICHVVQVILGFISYFTYRYLLIRRCEHQLDAYPPKRVLLYGVFDCAKEIKITLI